MKGPLNYGTVLVHLTKQPSEHERVFHYLALQVDGKAQPFSIFATLIVAGHKRIVLEDRDKKGGKKLGLRLFGVNW